jgi:hypothetical protein
VGGDVATHGMVADMRSRARAFASDMMLSSLT